MTVDEAVEQLLKDMRNRIGFDRLVRDVERDPEVAADVRASWATILKRIDGVGKPGEQKGRVGRPKRVEEVEPPVDDEVPHHAGNIERRRAGRPRKPGAVEPADETLSLPEPTAEQTLLVTELTPRVHIAEPLPVDGMVMGDDDLKAALAAARER